MITKRKYPIHTKTKVVSARIPEELLKKVDLICKATGRSRSDVITQILGDYSFEYNAMEIKCDFDFDTTE